MAPHAVGWHSWGTMTAPLHVLVYGSIGEGVCDVYRLGMYRERLAALGVEMRTWGDFNDYLVQVPAGYEDRIDDAIRDGVAQIDRTPIDWADVIVFRRWYGLTPACNDCDTVGSNEAAIATHCAATGHTPNYPDRIVAALLASFESQPELLRGRAIVYETDDNLLASLPWVGFHRRLQPDRWLIERLARRADLVTVTTPVLARAMGRFNDEVRVVRNAIDPAWYAAPPSGPRPEGDPRILYYGAGVRVRDYAICRDAIDDVARRNPAVRRIWLGESERPDVRAMVDEALPYVRGVPAFARALVDARPDIGVAPVVGDDFDRAHSELHWLEYSLAGAATVASRTMGGGPYDVIRDGVDGLLARNKGQWRDQLRRLVASTTLRQELAGRARERVLAEYTADQRAQEWADAYRWAAAHGGRGARPGVGRAGSRGTTLSRAAQTGAVTTAAAVVGSRPMGSPNPSDAPPAPLHALLIGAVEAPPPESGIVARAWPSIDVILPGTLQDQPLAAYRQGLAEFDTRPLAWADLLVLHNGYVTVAACLSCPLASLDEAALLEHAAATGHHWRRPYEGHVRGFVEALDRDPGLLRGRALVYELDHDPWSQGPAADEHEGSALERDLIRLLLRTADLVVAGTPDAAVAADREGARQIAPVPANDHGWTRADAWWRAASLAGTGRISGIGATAAALAEASERAARRLDHRLQFRSLDAAAAQAIEARRNEGGVCWNEADAIDPLVSVLIPVVGESSALVERSIRSALDIEGVRVEVIVAALPRSGGAEAVARLRDPRVRLADVAEPQTHVDTSAGADGARDDAARAAATAAAHDAARGTWLAPLDPGSVLLPGGIPLLLAVAIEHGLEIVYGRTLLVHADEAIGQVGSWPPGPGAIAGDAALIAGALRVVRPDPEAWREDEGTTWNLWRRYLELGVRIGNVEEIVTVRDASEPVQLDGAA